MTTRHIENKLAEIEGKAQEGLAQAQAATQSAQAATNALTEVIASIQSLREAIKEPA